MRRIIAVSLVQQTTSGTHINQRNPPNRHFPLTLQLCSVMELKTGSLNKIHFFVCLFIYIWWTYIVGFSSRKLLLKYSIIDWKHLLIWTYACLCVHISSYYANIGVKLAELCIWIVSNFWRLSKSLKVEWWKLMLKASLSWSFTSCL